LAVTALGGSVGTPAGGLSAPVVEVQSLADVERLGSGVRGKIVFYNRPMDPTIDTFKAYGKAVDQRVAGPSQAARFGAVAVLVRSMTTLADDDHPHTGTLAYHIDAPKIPAAALSTHAANLLSQQLKADPTSVVTLTLSAEDHGFAPSSNVVADLLGSERPNEVVLVGGHLDSWDLGVGAHDDGAGVTEAMEVLRAIKALGLKPRRTIRVVLFMTEELGGFGARDYATAMKHSGITHVAAIESDRGGFAPRGFETDAGPAALARLAGFQRYLRPLGAGLAEKGGSGTDVEPLAGPNTATIGLVPDGTHYFDYHHSVLDQLSAVKPQELSLGAAAMAVLAYLYAQDAGVATH
jgi:hypothetical protein